MNDVVDAEIIRLIVVEVRACSECPYCDEVSDKWGELQDVFYCAKMSEGLDEWKDEHIIPESVLKSDVIWDKCPLPLTMCVTTEEVQE